MNESTSIAKPAKKTNVRQIILVAVLLIVFAAFLYDRYVLIPSATEKINKITNEISLKLSDENRQQVHDIAGIKPWSSFQHNGIEVEQYRFPRGLPFFPRPILDVAFEGDTLAFFRQEPMDTAYIDQNHRPKTAIDMDTKDHPGESEIGF